MFYIGEKMSELVELDPLIENSFGDLYEGHVAYLQDKPLDTGRLLYAKLRRELGKDTEVEVIWNHFDDVITAFVGTQGIIEFRDRQMARTDKVAYIDGLVKFAKEAEQIWLRQRFLGAVPPGYSRHKR